MTRKRQAWEKNTKINFFGPETARWAGGLPRKGVVAEKFVLSLERLSSLSLEERNLGCPRNFAGMSRTPGGVQKVAQKKFVRISRSLKLAEYGFREHGLKHWAQWVLLPLPSSRERTQCEFLSAY